MTETTNPPTDPANWILPGGRSGMQGTATAVLAAIAGDPTIPPHAKNALTEAIAAHLEGSDHNFITLHANITRHRDHEHAHNFVNYSLSSSKKLI